MKSAVKPIILNLVFFFIFGSFVRNAYGAPEKTPETSPQITWAITAASVATLGLISYLEDDFRFSGEGHYIGGYILGSLYLLPPLLSPKTAGRTTTGNLLSAAGFVALSAYNFAELTNKEIKGDEILVANVIGLGALVGWQYFIHKIFDATSNSEAQNAGGKRKYNQLVWPSIAMDSLGHQYGRLNFVAKF